MTIQDFKKGTLVRHPDYKYLGVVAKINKKSLVCLFDEETVLNIHEKKLAFLSVVDTSKAKKVPFRDLRDISMVAGNEKRYHQVILGHRLKEWVGIGWIDRGGIIEEDLTKHWLAIG